MSRVAEKERTSILVAIQELQQTIEKRFKELQTWHQQIGKEHDELKRAITEAKA